jgi:hypothetical protein
MVLKQDGSTPQHRFQLRCLPAKMQAIRVDNVRPQAAHDIV